MENVICDVCGTAYPETEAQCPICGCACSDGGQTSAGNTEEGTGYAYTKGGRFSKSNVRKRLKAAQIQPVPVEIPSRIQEPEEQDYDDYDYDEEEDEEGGTSNRGLIAIVVVLLLAIIAVSSYIAIVHLDLFGTSATSPSNTTVPSQSSTSSTDYTGTRVPCTDLSVDDEIKLQVGGFMQLSFVVEPLDTTDEVMFQSSNTNVATVDTNGRVTAVGSGEAVITITCGDFTKECVVNCVSGTDQPDNPDKPSDPEQPTDPTPSETKYELKLNGTKPAYPIGDYSCEATFKTGASFTLRVVDESGKAMDVVWTASKDGYVIIEGNTITCYKPVTGHITISATYAGNTYSCIVRINGTAIPFPGEETEEPENPDDTQEPENPDETKETYTFYIGSDARPQDADISIYVGDKYNFKIMDSMGRVMDVEWTASEQGVCEIDGNSVSAVSTGRTTISGTYDGQTFTCIVRVYER